MTITSTAKTCEEPEEVAPADVGLRHVSDATPGIRRRRRGKHFDYRDAKGAPIEDAEVLARIRALAVPPAWTDVWICPHSNGYLQATGRDKRGRKQYRYHSHWREVREESKFDRLVQFAAALPALRERVDSDLSQRGITRERVLATVVRLLETTRMRVGNEEYARSNGSYGLTTLRNEHAEVATATVSFTFRGKSGKEHAVRVHDRRLARIVRQCRDLPGHELFEYLDEAGERHSVSSTDVNEYIREIAGQQFTAKDFRTWTGTVLAALALRAVGLPDSEAEGARKVKEALETVSAALGNTVAVCRKSYVHPSVVDAYLSGRVIEPDVRDVPGLSQEESATLALLRA
jgi:DNA topoisomerase-1